MGGVGRGKGGVRSAVMHSSYIIGIVGVAKIVNMLGCESRSCRGKPKSCM